MTDPRPQPTCSLTISITDAKSGHTHSFHANGDVPLTYEQFMKLRKAFLDALASVTAAAAVTYMTEIFSKEEPSA